VQEIIWHQRPEGFRGDIVSVATLSEAAWELLGARFTKVDDGQGELVNVARGSYVYENQSKDFAVLGYEQETTYLLIPATGTESIALADQLHQALTTIISPYQIIADSELRNHSAGLPMNQP